MPITMIPFPIIRIALLAASLACAGAAAGGVCTAPPPDGYGDGPATLEPRQASGKAGLKQRCAVPGSRKLRWTDANGTARYACLLVPKSASAGSPLPLLVWLHASLETPNEIEQTGLVAAADHADLSGDPSRAGFVLLVPAGRSIGHLYPPPDDRGTGWDNWYRNLDRGSAALNVDVAAIDHFIAEAKALGVVDAQRIYLSGWSNGAAMAQLYALNTPGIAAAAVYSSADPFRDVDDPCAQTPFASRQTPLMDIHNDCDLLGFCQSGQHFHGELATLYPALVQKPLIIDAREREATACDAACATQDAYLGRALIRHTRWPRKLNDTIFAFFREHPLP